MLSKENSGVQPEENVFRQSRRRRRRVRGDRRAE